MGNKPRVRVSDEELCTKIVEAVKRGNGHCWIADELGIPTSTLSSRICRLRKAGVQIPVLPTARRTPEMVAKLNAILAGEIRCEST